MTNSIRKTKVPYGILTASCLAASSLIHATPQADTILISGQKTEVVVCPGAPEPTRFAACEMTNHLSKIFGVDVPLVTKPTDGRYSIILGTNGWSRAAGLAPETLKRDSFCVRIERGRAFIAGCDDPKCSIGDMLKSGRTVPFERATFFGVYGFLDRHAGVRFYFPGELGTVVPRSDSIGLPVGSYSVTPRFSARDCYIGGAGPYPGIAAGDRKAQSRAKARYRLFLREETERVRCCHGQNAFRIAERFSESRPEYFQLRKNGTRCTGTKFAKNWMGRQLCHTSKVWDIFRRETVERIRKGEKYVDVMPQDGMSPCWCDTCQKTFNTTNFNLASGYATELIWSNTVEIAKAVSYNAKILVLDEPTSSLTSNEVEALFRIIEDLKADGVAIVYISHKMDEILRISDEVTVMRDGQYIGTWDMPVDEHVLVHHMVGREITQLFPKKETEIGREVLKVENDK